MIAKKIHTLFIFSLLLMLVACRSEKVNEPSTALFRLLDNEEIGIDFINKVVDQENFNVLTYRNYYNGGGVAVGDINNDGWADLFFTANMGPNQLYLNKGNLKFENISVSAGIEGTMKWSTGVTMADVNGDGFLDIYVCNSGDVDGNEKKNELFINNGDLTFAEASEAFGLDDVGFSTHASFFDMDGDGDLDMYLLNNSFKDPSRIDYKNIRNERDKEGGDKLFRNDNNRFVDVSEAAGIYGSKIGFGLGISVSDVNGDYLPDMYISNDFWERDYLYINQGDGTFTEELTSRMPVISTTSMGADIGDLDNNGSAEIFSTDMLPATSKRLKTTTIFNDYKLEDLKYRNDYYYQSSQNCLQANDGTGHFLEIANQAGVAATDWSWGALFFDFDNDGNKDIYVSNGVYHDITDMDFADFLEDNEEVKKVIEKKGRFDFRDFLEYLPSTPLSNYAFVNTGNLSFDNKAFDLGLGQKSFSNGAAYGDLDNDGDLDLVVNNVNMGAFVYENLTTGTYDHSFIRVKFDGKTHNTFGIGAHLEITTDQQTYYFQNYQARGFQSSTEPVITAGLGGSKHIDALRVIWPTGFQQILTDVNINSEIVLEEESAVDEVKNSTLKEEALFFKLKIKSPPAHRENLFNDFDHERLTLHMLSTEGPKLLTGDLDANGTLELVLLGADGDEDKVLFQNSQGDWQKSVQPILARDSIYESTCGILYDLDNDGDKDLIIGSGGNDLSKGIDFVKIRSYLNDGNALFKENTTIVLPAAANLSCIKPIQLGEKRALFFGARAVPANYGLTPRNFLLLEQSPGFWRDITDQDIGQIGMITDASVDDIDGDGDEDLLVVGEWMPVTIFENNGRRLMLKGSVPNSSGLWQSIESADLDKDGDVDFILGNWGNNSKLKASKEKPLTMFVNDFDNNKKPENILLWYAPEDETPSIFAAKRDLTGQLPQLKKKILKNKDYADIKFEDLFDQNMINASMRLQVTDLRSSLLVNQGNFGFFLQDLPLEAQRSVVFASEAGDFNGDGHTDLILGGNLYGLKPEIGRMDSSCGLVLLSDGKGSYHALSKEQSGLYIKGEIRDIKTIDSKKGKKLLIFARNNDNLEFYKVNE